MDEKNLVEAALFASGGPVSDGQLKTVVNRSATYISQLIDRLIEEYQARNSPLEIIRLDSKYVMQLKPEYSRKVMSVSPKELSPGVLRTPAPSLGQHNVEIYERIGYSRERIQALAAGGVI